LPADIFGAERGNSKGWDITDPVTLAAIEAERAPFAAPHRWQAGGKGKVRTVVNPARPLEEVGEVAEADAAGVTRAVDAAVKAQAGWQKTPVAQRAAMLLKAADLYENHAVEFFALCAREAGKTLADGVAELREAADFLRYYAGQAA